MKNGALIAQQCYTKDFIVVFVITIRYDTIRDAILTCARKPT